MLGTRPEVIKLAPFIRALRVAAWAEADVLLTGQHGAMLRPLLDHFELGPASDLCVQMERGSLNGITAFLCAELDGHRDVWCPDLAFWFRRPGEKVAGVRVGS